MATRVGSLLLLATASLAFRSRSSKKRNVPNISIVNGTDAEPCKWKWQVGLYSVGGSEPFCGGTLISPTWVVTAHHCVLDDPMYDVMAGDILPGKGQRRSSARVIMKSDADIALIELSEPFTLNECVDVAKLPTKAVPDDTQCWITGWGRLGETDVRGSTLQQATTQVVNNQECRRKMGALRDGDVCVLGSYKGNPTSSCYGDSGGPLVCQTGDDDAWAVYGATSWGNRCDGITVYAGTFGAMDWIAANYVDGTPAPAATALEESSAPPPATKVYGGA